MCIQLFIDQISNVKNFIDSAICGMSHSYSRAILYQNQMLVLYIQAVTDVSVQFLINTLFCFFRFLHNRFIQMKKDLYILLHKSYIVNK